MPYRVNPRDLDHGRVQRGEHLERAVAEDITPGAGVEHCPHQWPIDHALVAAGDADGDGLGLVLDGVDRARQLLDRPCQRHHEVVDEGSRRPDLAGPRLVLLDRTRRRHVAQQAGQAHRRARLEMAVVALAAQIVDVLIGRAADVLLHSHQHRIRRWLARHGSFDDLPRLAQRSRQASIASAAS